MIAAFGIYTLDESLEPRLIQPFYSLETAAYTLRAAAARNGWQFVPTSQLTGGYYVDALGHCWEAR